MLNHVFNLCIFLSIIFGVESTGAYCTFLLAMEPVPQLCFYSLKHWFPNSIFWVAGTGANSTFFIGYGTGSPIIFS